MITIFRIDIQNGNSWPPVRSFVCNKTIHLSEAKVYKKRLKLIYERRLNRHVEVSLRYKEVQSKYDET